MPHRPTRIRFLLSSSILPAGLLFLSLLPPGCGSEKTLRTSPDPYRGPTLTVDTTGAAGGAGGQHFALFEAPSGGWAVQLDRTQRDLYGTTVYITARRPNPAFPQTQAILEHRIATGVPTTTPLNVYARIVDHNQREADVPYRPASTGNVNSSPVPLLPPASSAPR